LPRNASSTKATLLRTRTSLLSSACSSRLRQRCAAGSDLPLHEVGCEPCEDHGVLLQHLVRPIVGRTAVKQKDRRALLPVRLAGRPHLLRPARRQMNGVTLTTRQLRGRNRPQRRASVRGMAPSPVTLPCSYRLESLCRHVAPLPLNRTLVRS